MPNGVNGVKRKRQTSQKGIEAVFTTDDPWRARAQVLAGISAIVAGSGSWAYSARGLEEMGLGTLMPWNSSIASFLLPISIPLLIGGVGLCTYYLAMRRTWRASNRIESALYELEALVANRTGMPEQSIEPEILPRTIDARKPRLRLPHFQFPRFKLRIRFGIVSKALMIASAEAVILIIMYSGLVEEYTSNINMQNWIRANFGPGSYLLSFNAVLVVTGLLGVLIFQLLPKKFQSRSSRPSSRRRKTLS